MASDVETRSLLLVLDRSVAWNGLSLAQQWQLQRQIKAFTSFEPLYKTARPVPVITNWLANGKTLVHRLPWSNRAPQNYLPLSMFAQSVERSLPESSTLAVHSQTAFRTTAACRVILQSEASERLPVRLISSQMVALTPPLLPYSKTLSDSDEATNFNQDVMEAEVVFAAYVEHPLERLLKWVDRILLWIETQCPSIKQKLIEQAKTLFHQ